MSDLDPVTALRPRDPDSDHFGHLDHVHMAWVMIGRYGPAKAEEVLCTVLPLSLRNAGAPPEKFHETLTRAWCRVVAAAMGEGWADFDALLAGHPELADRGLLGRHYSSERLFTEEARTGFVEPDLAPLPDVD